MKIRPFRGLRPRPELAAQVASPPYDVLSTAEARLLAADNPYTFLRVNKAEMEFDNSIDPYSEKVYMRSHQNLLRLVNQGVMVRDATPMYYAYRLTMGAIKQTGLAALCSVRDYLDGKIKKHEHTHPEKVDDRTRHILATRAQVGPVLLAFRSDDRVLNELNRVTEGKQSLDFVGEDNVRHEFWVIKDNSTITRLTRAFAAMDFLYIADGHHRSEAAAEACRRLRNGNSCSAEEEPCDFFLAVMFDQRELHILAYNRVVKDLGKLTADEFLLSINKNFTVEKQDKEVIPSRTHTLGMYMDNQWYLLTLKEGILDINQPTSSIEAAVLSEHLLRPVLGINDLRKDGRIDFVGGVRGTAELVRLVDSGNHRLAFSLYPTKVEQLMNVADAGEVMPPKSTWFEPKLRSGMVVSLLDE